MNMLRSCRISLIKSVERIQSTRFVSTIVPEYPPSLLNLKVGQILRCEKHENADSLYVSQIQISGDAESAPLTVCSGLVKYIPIDQMKNRRVVVVTNLKPSKMRGVRSEAMLLAADMPVAGAETVVELINPPTDAMVGDSLFFKPFIREVGIDPPRLKNKAWDEIQKLLKTNSNSEAVYLNGEEECRLQTDGGVESARADSLSNASIR